MAQFKQITALTSGTVTITDTGTDVQLIHTPALTATLTIAFPATPYDGQQVSISSQKRNNCFDIIYPSG